MSNQRKFAVFDIDGTVIRWQLYHAIVGELANRGLLTPGAAETIRSARMTWKKRGHRESFREYEHTLVHTFENALTKVAVTDFMAVVDAVFEEHKDQVYTYTRDLIRQLKAEDYMLFTISGSYQQIIDKLSAYYGFDDAIGTVYQQKDGLFSNEELVVVGRKGILLKELIAKHNVTLEGSIAVGDSSGDIPMFEIVENPIAFNPDMALFKEAQKHGWKIVVERKNMTYELEQVDGQYVLAQTAS